jgi:hypothetical protein
MGDGIVRTMTKRRKILFIDFCSKQLYTPTGNSVQGQKLMFQIPKRSSSGTHCKLSNTNIPKSKLLRAEASFMFLRRQGISASATGCNKLILKVSVGLATTITLKQCRMKKVYKCFSFL